ncbi:thiosulfate sulfurtransferase/rhodanese-like domain-containing protein 3 [Neosynchiropus ocellatus]
MALRRCLRFSSVVPRLLWNYSPRPGVSLSSLVNTRSASTNKPLLRGFSTSPPSTCVSYDQLKQILAQEKAVVIDVREPWELREYGFIPGSLNVPLAQVNTALQLGPDEFKEKYGGEMPEQSDMVVFTCLAGVRSKSAVDTATSLGYKDVQNYAGGWQDWVKNEQNK